MKKVILSLAFVFAGVFAMMAQEVVSGPAISVDKDVHDYGTINKGADGTSEFTVTNTGTEPLIISKCKGSCGCTVPQCEKTPIAPGETSKVKVKYDTNRVGPINKSVTITSNAVNEPTKIVRIKGKVENTASQNSMPMKQQSSGAPVNN